MSIEAEKPSWGASRSSALEVLVGFNMTLFAESTVSVTSVRED